MPTRGNAVPNVALYNLRDAAGWSQQELADHLNEIAREYGEVGAIDGNHISRWERGVVSRPRPAHQRMLARVLGASIDDLGFRRPRSVATTASATAPDRLDVTPLAQPIVQIDEQVVTSQHAWVNERNRLNAARIPLAHAAARLYDTRLRLPATGLLFNDGWIPPQPLPIGDVALTLDQSAPGPTMAGFDAVSQHVRPLATAATRYSRYTQALHDLQPPRLLENRLSYRLTSLATAQHDATAMTFGLTTYFEMADVCDAVAHESAIFSNGSTGRNQLHLPAQKLTLRKWIGDPFDLQRRSVLPSTNTLTIRADSDEATFLLHRRDAASVAIAGDALHVMPAGVFQPSSVFPSAIRTDFSLTRNIMREFSEEFLRSPEHNGDGLPANYTVEPLRSLGEAIQDGRCRIYYLGTALDALTLAGEILTVAVFEPDTYDRLFANMPLVNDEGTVVTVGEHNPRPALPFTRSTVQQLLDDYRLLPGGAGCLRLAWEHRRTIGQI